MKWLCVFSEIMNVLIGLILMVSLNAGNVRQIVPVEPQTPADATPTVQPVPGNQQTPDSPSIDSVVTSSMVEPPELDPSEHAEMMEMLESIPDTDTSTPIRSTARRRHAGSSIDPVRLSPLPVLAMSAENSMDFTAVEFRITGSVPNVPLRRNRNGTWRKYNHRMK